MKFAEWIQSHRRSIPVPDGGLGAGRRGQQSRAAGGLFPQVDFPRVVVSLEAGDRPADRMAIEVTCPVEEAVRAVPGVRDVRSTTSRGSADIS